MRCGILVLQEFLPGFSGIKVRKDIIDRFSVLPFLNLDRQGNIDAAELRNRHRLTPNNARCAAVVAERVVQELFNAAGFDESTVQTALARRIGTPGSNLTIEPILTGAPPEWAHYVER